MGRTPFLTRTDLNLHHDLKLFASCFSMLSVQIAGDLKGIVLDNSAAAISAAKVTLRSIETGYTRNTTTGEDGRFAFSLLQIGSYEVKAEAPNFRATLARAEVKTGEIASLRFVLEIGQVTETVTVTDAVSNIDTENAQLQTSVIGEEVQEIPVLRNPNLFALTAPGVAPVSAKNPFLGSGSFNSNGGRGVGTTSLSMALRPPTFR